MKMKKTKSYLIGFQNEDKSINITKVNISDTEEALLSLMQKVNETKTSREIHDRFVFGDRIENRNLLINELKSRETDGLFVFISHFWLYSDGVNLSPLDSLLK